MPEEYQFRKEDFEPQKLPQSPVIEKKQIENTNILPDKRNIFVLVLLTIVTLGIYQAVWYLKRSPEFHNLGTQKKLSKTLPTIYLTLIIMAILIAIAFPFTVSGTDFSNFYQAVTPTQTTLVFGFFGVLLISKIIGIILSFISRSIINQALSEKYSRANVSGLFTFIFGFFYIQYEINRIIKDEEEKPKKGPWVTLIIIILAILSQIILALISSG